LVNTLHYFTPKLALYLAFDVLKPDGCGEDMVHLSLEKNVSRSKGVTPLPYAVAHT
jgi:hypothetical protein